MKIVLDIRHQMVDDDILELVTSIREMIRNGDPIGDPGTYTFIAEDRSEDEDDEVEDLMISADEEDMRPAKIDHLMWREHDDSSFHYSATQYRLTDGRVYNTENGVNKPLYKK